MEKKEKLSYIEIELDNGGSARIYFEDYKQKNEFVNAARYDEGKLKTIFENFSAGIEQKKVFAFYDRSTLLAVSNFSKNKEVDSKLRKQDAVLVLNSDVFLFESEELINYVEHEIFHANNHMYFTSTISEYLSELFYQEPVDDPSKKSFNESIFQKKAIKENNIDYDLKLEEKFLNKLKDLNEGIEENLNNLRKFLNNNDVSINSYKDFYEKILSDPEKEKEFSNLMYNISSIFESFKKQDVELEIKLKKINKKIEEEREKIEESLNNKKEGLVEKLFELDEKKSNEIDPELIIKLENKINDIFLKINSIDDILKDFNRKTNKRVKKLEAQEEELKKQIEELRPQYTEQNFSNILGLTVNDFQEKYNSYEISINNIYISYFRSLEYEADINVNNKLGYAKTFKKTEELISQNYNNGYSIEKEIILPDILHPPLPERIKYIQQAAKDEAIAEVNKAMEDGVVEATEWKGIIDNFKEIVSVEKEKEGSYNVTIKNLAALENMKKFKELDPELQKIFLTNSESSELITGYKIPVNFAEGFEPKSLITR